jgi:hypothetical protein
MEDLIMKKLIMFVMVLMLCMGTAAKAEPVAAWCFSDTLVAAPMGGDYPATMYAGAEAYDGAGPPPGGSAILLDGTNSVELPLGAANPLDHTADWSIAMWFKVPQMAAGTGALLLSSARDETPDNHSYALFLEVDGNLRVDMFFISAVVGETTDLDDGTWHHVAVTFVESTAMTTIYLDGAEDGADPIEGTIPNIEEDTILIGDTLNAEFPAEEGVEPLIGSVAHVALFAEALDLAGVQTAMDDGFPCSGPKNPIVIDPNQMLVYETGETEGNFEVSLKFPPMGQGSPGNPDFTPLTVNIIVDPNGYGGGTSPDITLIGGSGPHNRITFTRTIADWNTPKVIRFKAIDDAIAEPPSLIEAQNIVVWAEPVATTEPNWSRPVAQKNAGGSVWDNDQADILFTVTPSRQNTPKNPVTGPVQLWEEPKLLLGSPQIKWRKIGVTLQVPPLIDGDPCQPSSVKLQAVVEGDIAGDNLPLTTPTLPYQETDDPNGLIFTAANYNVSQTIQIWGNDDDVLQVEGAEADGDEDYQATLVVTVVDDGGDSRFTDLERIVDIDIEDNECGAYGILPMDVSNSHYITDPNWAEDDPDCYVDIYDVIRMAKRWLNCTDPQGTGCAKPE